MLYVQKPISKDALVAVTDFHADVLDLHILVLGVAKDVPGFGEMVHDLLCWYGFHTTLDYGPSPKFVFLQLAF